MSNISLTFQCLIGRGTGSFIGGILIANYGSRAAFQIMGTSASVLGVVYIVLYFIVFRKYERKPLKNLTGDQSTSTGRSFIYFLFVNRIHSWLFCSKSTTSTRLKTCIVIALLSEQRLVGDEIARTSCDAFVILQLPFVEKLWLY